jgi:hypothetical protein
MATITDTETIVRRYIDSWNETDPARRRTAVEALYTPEGGYTDPLVSVRGWDAIDQTMAGGQQQFGGLVFSLGGGIDAHHDIARFTWHLGAPGAEPVVIGFDVAVIEGDRIRQVYGFLDKVPA